MKYFMSTNDLVRELKAVELTVTDLAGKDNLVNAAIEKIEHLTNENEELRNKLDKNNNEE